MAIEAKGSASYFPSIEETYDRLLGEWLEIVHQHLPAKHMALVAMLKTDHGMGHGPPTRLWCTRWLTTAADLP